MNTFDLNTRINYSVGATGIILLGIFCAWFPFVVLEIPFPNDPIDYSVVNALWLFTTMVVLPYTWAYFRLGMKPSDLGLNTSRLPLNILLGVSLYSVALAAFIHCSGDPMIKHHMVSTVDGADAAILTGTMGLVAVSTDLATRGFLLLVLAKYSNLWIAIIMQNLLWFAGHIHEINMLSNCLGYELSILLTLFLGLAGDAITLKTRSVVGLAVAHFALNITLVLYIRGL